MSHRNLPYRGTESRINSGRNDDDQRFDRYERRWRFRFRQNGDVVWAEVAMSMDEAESAARAVLEALNQAVQTLLGFFLCFVIVLVIILIFSDSNSHRR